MAAHALVVEVRLLTGRYHGTRDWPPSPFRLFQALVAGAYGGRWTAEPRRVKDAAFAWLEELDAPCTSAPTKQSGCSTTYYVPNNDLDSKGGDPRHAGDIRVAKDMSPVLVANDASFLYAWQFHEGVEHAQTVCVLADRLHTLGRGIDAAFARATVAIWSEAEERLRAHGGTVARPTRAQGTSDDPTCPTAGSLQSLEARFVAQGKRFETAGRETLFRQPPKPEFRTVGYDRPITRLLFELRTLNGAFRPVPQTAAIEIVSLVRHRILERLRSAMPSLEADVRRAVEGGGSVASDRASRILVVSLPTIGHQHASAGIRRVLVEIPPGCPLRAGDVAWAVTGQVLESLTRVDKKTGEVIETQLVPSDDDRMLRHYGVGIRSRRWRTVTPVAIDLDQPKGKLLGSDRVHRIEKAARKIAEAVRDAGLPVAGLIVHAQREPFHAKGLRSDQFRVGAMSTRALFHAELILQEPVVGPIILGAGRYNSLGIFRPAEPPVQVVRGRAADRERDSGGDRRDGTVTRRPSRDTAEVARFVIKDGPSVASTIRIAEVARSALMSKLGEHCPPEISGRNEAGPLRCESEHVHAFYLPEDADGDGFIDHLLIYCARGFRKDSKRAMDSLSKLWTGVSSGSTSRDSGEWRIALEMFSRPEDLRLSRLVGLSTEWVSVTPYLKPRYDRKPARDFDARVASYSEQITREWRKRFAFKPLPRIEALRENGRFVPPKARSVEADAFVRTRQGRGGHQPDVVGGFFKLTFERPVFGPIALGKHAHFGMGLFERAR